MSGHGHLWTLGGAGVMVRGAEIVAMLPLVPEATEKQVKGNTPRGAGRLVIAEGDRIEKLSANAEALAYAHLTQMVMSGQRTGRVNRTQNASGVRS